MVASKRAKPKRVAKAATKRRAPKVAPILGSETVLVLRMCKADMTSRKGFRWPESGPVEAPNWNSRAECGGGLHGWLWGEGDASAWAWNAGDRALVVEVDGASIVQIDRKVKFPRGVVVFSGDLKDAAAMVHARSPDKTRPVIGLQVSSGDGGTSTSGSRGTSTSGSRGTSTSGDDGTSTSGSRGTSTSGDDGTSTSGDDGTSTSGSRGTSTSGYGGTSTSGSRGTSTSGSRGTSTSGDDGTSTSGSRGTSTSGDDGTSTSGDDGTSTSGYGGTSTSGHGGTSTSGYGGTSTSGHGGTSTSGSRGTSTSGYGGEIRIRWYDAAKSRYRTAIAYVGEDGIEAGVAYCLGAQQRFVRKDGKS